jgi:hypothetical protein
MPLNNLGRKCAFVEELAAWRWLIISVIALGVSAGPLGAQQYNKEYIYLGGRLVAVHIGGSALPTADSVSPSFGSGSSQTFTYTFSDVNGFADILWTQMLVNATLTSLNGCNIFFWRAANQIQLLNDGGTAWSSPLTLGTAGTLQNSQCILDAGLSSSSGTGNTLTVVLRLTFKPAFAGGKSNYLLANDLGNGNSTWVSRGSWTVP